MGAIFHAIQTGVCWVLSIPPQAYEQVANLVKAVVCGTPPTP